MDSLRRSDFRRHPRNCEHVRRSRQGDGTAFNLRRRFSPAFFVQRAGGQFFFPVFGKVSPLHTSCSRGGRRIADHRWSAPTNGQYDDAECLCIAFHPHLAFTTTLGRAYYQAQYDDTECLCTAFHPHLAFTKTLGRAYYQAQYDDTECLCSPLHAHLAFTTTLGRAYLSSTV